MSLSLVIDIVVAVLLIVTICYATVLNKRLGNLRRDRSELEKLAINFHASTARADESIGHLRASVDGLQEQIEKAESMRDDLIFLTERGSATADRLEESVRLSRASASGTVGSAAAGMKAEAPKPVVPKAQEPVKKEGVEPRLRVSESDRIDAAEPVSKAEKDLLKALRSAS